MVDPVDAMAMARGVKAARTDLRHGLAAGDVSVAALLDGTADPEMEAAALGMTILDLLTACPSTRSRTVEIAIAGNLLHLNHRLRDLPTQTRQAMATTIRKGT
jgi:hypothetical protein